MSESMSTRSAIFAEFVRTESENMIKDYLLGILKTKRTSVPIEEIEIQTKKLIEGCYKSFLDSDFNTRLTQILPAIECQQI